MAQLDQDLLERIQDGGETGGRIEGRILEIIAPLEAERDQVLAEKQAVLEYLKSLDEQIRRVDRIIRAARNPGGEKKKRGPAQEASRPAQKRLDEVFALIASAPAPITNRELAELADFSRPTVNAATYWLRKEGKIRRAGTGPNQSSLWAIGTEEA